MIDTLKRLVIRFIRNERAVQVAAVAVFAWLVGPAVLDVDIPADAEGLHRIGAVAIGVAAAAVRFFVYGPQTFNDAVAGRRLVDALADAERRGRDYLSALRDVGADVVDAFEDYGREVATRAVQIAVEYRDKGQQIIAQVTDRAVLEDLLQYALDKIGYEGDVPTGVTIGVDGKPADPMTPVTDVPDGATVTLHIPDNA